MAKRSFQYQKRSKDDLKERANARGGNFDSFIKQQFKIYKVREGKNLLRILPPTWEKAKHYGYDIYVNYGIGADNQSYLSLSKMKDEADPLLEGRRAAERDGDEEVSRALRTTQRILMWVIDRMAEDDGPQLWAAPLGLDKGIANAAFDEDTGAIVYIDDPEKGCDVRFYKEGTGIKTKYPGEKIKLLNAAPIHEDEAVETEWLDYVANNPVPDCLQFYDYEHIAEVYNGQVRTAEPDEDEKPKRKPRDEEEAAPKRRAAAKPDLEEDEEPPFEEDETPPPRRRARAEPEEAAEEAPPTKAGGIRDRLAKARQAMDSKKDADEDN